MLGRSCLIFKANKQTSFKLKKTGISYFIFIITGIAFFPSMIWDCLRGSGPVTNPLTAHHTIHVAVWTNGGMKLTGKPKTRRKTCPSTALATQTPRGLPWARNSASAAWSQQLLAWTTAQLWFPHNYYYLIITITTIIFIIQLKLSFLLIYI
jgi:hypothetical protein